MIKNIIIGLIVACIAISLIIVDIKYTPFKSISNYLYSKQSPSATAVPIDRIEAHWSDAKHKGYLKSPNCYSRYNYGECKIVDGMDSHFYNGCIKDTYWHHKTRQSHIYIIAASIIAGFMVLAVVLWFALRRPKGQQAARVAQVKHEDKLNDT